MRLPYVGVFLLLSCTAPHRVVTSPLATRELAGTILGVVSAVDLPPGDPRCRELSGIAWDPKTRTLWAISDRSSQLVPFSPSDDWKTWTVGASVPVRIPGRWDGEGIAIIGDRPFIANEAGAHLYMLDWTGGVAAELELPRHFGSSVANKSLESLSATQDGRFLFTANESALTCDGAQPDADAGSIVRILRRTMASGQNVENAYRTDPNLAPGIGGDSGVTDLAALSPTEILVLERSFVPGVGNAVTLYHANFDGDDVTDIASLGGDTRVMKKTRLTSFRDIAGASVIPKSVGAAGFPNYEGMALGPPLEGGGRALFLISDDNGGSDQVARILVLRIAD